MSKEYQKRRAIRLNRKTAKSKLKAKALRIKSQQQKHEDADLRRARYKKWKDRAAGAQ